MENEFEYVPHLWENGERTIDADKLNHMETGIKDAPTKSSLGNAGFVSVEYETIFDTETVETTVHANKEYPWVMLSAQTGLVSHNNVYRVTFDDEVYVVAGQEWHSDVQIGKGIGFCGNASLWGNMDGFIEQINDVPFLFTSGMDDTTHTDGAYLFTEESGSHTIKFERVIYGFAQLPMELLYGFPHPAVYMVNGGGTGYNAYSIGDNALINKRATFAIGYHNIVSGDSAKAIGGSNTASGTAAIAIGTKNTASGATSTIVGGTNNTASGQQSVIVGGSFNTASGSMSSASGASCTASGVAAFATGNLTEASGTLSEAHGAGTKANHLAQFTFGSYNVPDPSGADATEKGNYIEIVGNGKSSAPSNARTLDWDGNEGLAGSITLGVGTEDETTITAAQLKQLIAMLG